MNELDDIEAFYASRNPKPKNKKSEFPDWVSTEDQKLFCNAIELRLKECQEYIKNIQRGEIEDVKKRDRLIQGTAVCEMAGLNRKALTPAKQPEIAGEEGMIVKLNKKLEKKFEERKATIKADRSKRRPELIKQNSELKSQIKSNTDQSLINYFKAFEASEYANTNDAVHAKLKKAKAEILSLEKENAHLRSRNSELNAALERKVPKNTPQSSIKLVKD
jgi:hypothetical protein